MPDSRSLSSIQPTISHDIPPASVSRSTRSDVTAAPPNSRGTLEPLRAHPPGRRHAMPQYLSSRPDERQNLRPWFATSRRRLRSPDDIQREDSESTQHDSPTRTHLLSQRHAKRRRIDETSSKPSPIKYGRYGQVETGRLKLNLISCDGGEHIDPHSPATSLGPHNILRHDQSVYCSERARANIVLAHADDTPFCLEKLNIIAPDDSFTAPVCEGLVYVGMNLDSLTPYIDPPPWARLQGADTPTHRQSTRSRRSSQEHISFSDALRDPDIDVALDRRSRGPRNEHLLRRHASTGQHYQESSPERYCNRVSSRDSSNTVISADGNGCVMTVTADADLGPEEASSQDVLDFRAQRLRATRRRSYRGAWSASDTRSGPQTAYNRPAGVPGAQRLHDTGLTTPLRTGIAHLDALMARSHFRNDASNGTDGPATSEFNTDARQTLSANGAQEDLNTPNVTATRFHMSPGKYKLAIHFDPPISGRFILLKLWAHKSNVDVQSIIAQGYGGCRFFPAINPR